MMCFSQGLPSFQALARMQIAICLCWEFCLILDLFHLQCIMALYQIAIFLLLFILLTKKQTFTFICRPIVMTEFQTIIPMLDQLRMGAWFLRRKLISTEEAYFHRGGQFLSNRLIFVWKKRTIAQRKQGCNHVFVLQCVEWYCPLTLIIYNSRGPLIWPRLDRIQFYPSDRGRLSRSRLWGCHATLPQRCATSLKTTAKETRSLAIVCVVIINNSSQYTLYVYWLEVFCFC